MPSSLQRVTDAVDAHHHLWSLETHPWLANLADGGHPAGPFRSVTPYSIEDYRTDMAQFGFTKSVYLQCHHRGEPQDETAWVQGMADEHGLPNAIVPYADLSRPDVETTLQQHCRHANTRGIRQMLDYHPTVEKWRQCEHDRYMTDPAWLAGLKLLPKYNLSFDIQLHAPQLMTAVEVVRSNPEVQFILNHCGFPAQLTDAAMGTWRTGMAALARHDNFAVKLSGFNQFLNDWSKDMLRPLLEHAINTFGVKRCMFASNFPVDKINATMEQLMSAYLDICCDLGLSQDDVNMMFRDNACKYYRI